MTAVSHIYVTAHGEYTSATWLQEHAQMGFRLAFASAVAAPSKGDTFEPQVNGDAVTTFGTQAGTHGTLTKTWKARVGPVGSVENFDATEQIDVAEDVWTLLNAIKTYQSSGYRWTHVKIAAIDATGHTVGTAATYTFTTPLAGGVASMLPPQLAFAVSVRANILGRSGRGRVYIPALAQTVLQTDGTIGNGSRDAFAGAMVSFVNNVQNLGGWSTYLPILMVTSPGKATGVRPVEVRVGNRLDTIKSRRQQVDETYTATQL